MSKSLLETKNVEICPVLSESAAAVRLGCNVILLDRSVIVRQLNVFVFAAERQIVTNGNGFVKSNKPPDSIDKYGHFNLTDHRTLFKL